MIFNFHGERRRLEVGGVEGLPQLRDDVLLLPLDVGERLVLPFEWHGSCNSWLEVVARPHSTASPQTLAAVTLAGLPLLGEEGEVGLPRVLLQLPLLNQSGGVLDEFGLWRVQATRAARRTQ